MFQVNGILIVAAVWLGGTMSAPGDFKYRVARDTYDCSSCHSFGLKGCLKVYDIDAWHLKDKDPGLGGISDPYVRVTAVKDAALVRVTKQTSSVKNEYDYHWTNEALYFGNAKWKHIDVSVWDKDSGSDDELMPVATYPICNFGVCPIEYMYGKSKLNFKIMLTPDRDDCNPNPCYNGGVCTDGMCGAFYCSCPSGYYGNTCRYRSSGGTNGRLDIISVDGGDAGFA